MKRILVATAIIILAGSPSYAQQLSGKYLDQPLPGSKPVIFAPGIVSLPDQYEYGSVFSKDGSEFFYAVDLGGRAEIRYMKRKQSGWGSPEKLAFSDQYSYNDPFLSPDQTKLFFISDMAIEGS
ncbi:MAG: hypothetical protein C0490_23595, partial [Marivirga sp.]|nr:hypothetical protein [Marivirga sp.]